MHTECKQEQNYKCGAIGQNNIKHWKYLLRK